MSNQLDEVVQSLRETILAGRFASGQKLRELALADELEVSRTLVRLALGNLESEGLVYREPNRGYRVGSFTLDEVTDAIIVRGELEGMAARLSAERGLSDGEVEQARALVQRMDEVLDQGMESIEARAHWIDLNAEFHGLIIDGSGNRIIAQTIAGLSRMPLVSSRALVFDQSDKQRSLGRIQAAHQDHKEVLYAILDRSGSRADHLMREHALKSARNKRASFDAMGGVDHEPRLPGLALVRA